MEISVYSDSYEVEALRHAFSRHCRDKEWNVVGLRITVEKLLWAPAKASVNSLKGALLERAEEVVKCDHGADTWDKWLEPHLAYNLLQMPFMRLGRSSWRNEGT